MNMREKIARAAYAAQWEGPYPESGVENGLALQVADAVLDAMEKWTPEMHKAGLAKFVEMRGRAPSTQLLNSYAAMIRAARDGK